MEQVGGSRVGLDLLLVDTGLEQVHRHGAVLVVQNEGHQSVRIVRLSCVEERETNRLGFDLGRELWRELWRSSGALDISENL